MRENDHYMLAVIQFTPSTQVSKTVEMIKGLLSSSPFGNDSIDCIVLPEYAFGTLQEWQANGIDSSEQLRQVKEGIGDISRRFQTPIVAGTIPYQTTKGRWRNRSYVFSQDGTVLGHYDKQRPFRTEKQAHLEAGTDAPIFHIKSLRMAILICSDLWFSELISDIASQVDFITVPAMTTVLSGNHQEYGRWAWQSLVTVRAKEHTIPIASADQVSREYANNMFTCGASCIADPSYRFIDEEGPSTQALKTLPKDSAGIIISRISKKIIHEYKTYRENVGLRR